RLGRALQLGRRRVGRVALPGLDGSREALAVRAEAVAQRLEEGDTRSGGELAVARQDGGGARRAGSFPAPGQQLLAQLDKVLRARLGDLAAVARAVDQGAAAVGDILQELAEERGVHGEGPVRGDVILVTKHIGGDSLHAIYPVSCMNYAYRGGGACV